MIQATGINKDIHEKYRKTTNVDEIYFIANFVVSRNTSQYRPYRHGYKITLTSHTFIEHKEGEIPLYSYSFFPLSDILKAKEQKNVDYLIDVIAYVQSIGELKEFVRDDHTTNKLRMVLIDNELKVQYAVKDDSGQASVGFWDKLAIQLLRKTVAELKALSKENQSFELPTELDDPIGKQMLIMSKQNYYNMKHPTSSMLANTLFVWT